MLRVSHSKPCGEQALKFLSPIILVGLNLLSFWPAQSFASPWAQGDNELFISSRVNYFRATGDFLSSTPGQASDIFERIETDTYAEYGLTDKYTISAKAVFGSSTIRNSFEIQQASGLSELEGYIQRQLWGSERAAGAISIIGALPSRFETGVLPGIETDGASLGVRFLYGRTLIAGPRKVVATVETDYRRRFGDAADQSRVDFTLGVEATPKISLLLQSFNQLSLRNAQNDGVDFDIYKVAPSAVWHGGRRWSLQAGAIYEYAGRNVPTGTTFFLGLWTRF